MNVPARGQAAPSLDADARLLSALLNGMEVGLAAMDRDGVLTHWNREAVRLLGWTAAEAVGRVGLEGWALRPGDADAVRGQLLGAAAGTPRVHEFALLTSDGRRVLVRAQAHQVTAPDGRQLGLYFAFSEAGAQVELERSLALAEALMDEAPTGVVLVDADLRPAAVGESAARWLDCDRNALLGHPLGEVLGDGVQELEAALQHVLATGKPLSGVKLWAALRTDPSRRRCWRSEFVRLGSPLGEEPVPLGVAWFFEDITLHEQSEQEGTVLRFRATQLRRAGQAAAECEDPMEGAVGYLDFVLAGFADYALLDVLAPADAGADPGDPGDVGRSGPADVTPGGDLVRAAVSPVGAPVQAAALEPTGIPARYGEVHPAVRALERAGTVIVSDSGAPTVPTTPAQGPGPVLDWALLRRWPAGTVHGLCTALRSRGRTVGVLTFLRGSGRQRFDRADTAYAEDIAARVAAAVDLAAVGQKV
ncbi:PAS domain-containing protein [Streptacidiphilus carbonis]|uniref:PAS domain-containing protein n=1 Tax=Streptacidiphilus carbonis TaxID=105422 RepID=UPI0005A5F8E0|nr:PAS domain-containing protein [Streptacidiphilus carbonis]